MGRRLYTKITEVLDAEISEISEQDCIDYIVKLVIDRTFDGYITEKKTIYEQLEKKLHVPIEPAPDEWDRLYNVDFFVRVKEKFIGLQIKPVSGVFHIPQIYRESDQQARTHYQFTTNFGGKVFYVYSEKVGNEKRIQNEDVVEQIRDEIRRLQDAD